MLQTQRVHPFPFRTRKLSSAVAKILYGRLYGKIVQCRHRGKGRSNPSLTSKKWRRAKREEASEYLILITYSLLLLPLNGGVAQLGEHLPCKQGVMGSNPIISTKATDKEIEFVAELSGFEGESVQSKLPVDVCDRGRPSAQFARERIPSSPPTK